MNHSGARVWIGLALAGLLPGCAAVRPNVQASQGTPARQVQLKVPFFPDGTDQCGPSALASVLGYWGRPEPPERLRQEIYRAGLGGSLTVDLLLAAQGRGLAAEMSRGSLERLKLELDAGHPVIAFVNTGWRIYPIGHFLVVTGYDDQKRCLFAHSGKGRDRAIPYRTFSRQWDKTDNLGLVIVPPFDARTWTVVGNAAFTEKRLADAEAAFRKALELSPQDPGAANNLAMTLLERGGSLREAEALALDALERSGDLRPYVLDTLVQIRSRQAKVKGEQ